MAGLKNSPAIVVIDCLASAPLQNSSDFTGRIGLVSRPSTPQRCLGPEPLVNPATKDESSDHGCPARCEAEQPPRWTDMGDPGEKGNLS